MEILEDIMFRLYKIYSINNQINGTDPGKNSGLGKILFRGKKLKNPGNTKDIQMDRLNRQNQTDRPTSRQKKQIDRKTVNCPYTSQTIIRT